MNLFGNLAQTLYHMDLFDLYEVTQFETDDDRFVFEFESVSATKTILKRVQYEPIEDPSYPKDSYVLSFGDVGVDDEIQVNVVSNNGDRDKVLCTVISTLYEFFRTLPAGRVYFVGYTDRHDILYNRIAAHYAHKLEHLLRIYGLIGNEEEPYARGNTYEVFVIRQH